MGRNSTDLRALVREDLRKLEYRDELFDACGLDTFDLKCTIERLADGAGDDAEALTAAHFHLGEMADLIERFEEVIEEARNAFSEAAKYFEERQQRLDEEREAREAEEEEVTA